MVIIFVKPYTQFGKIMTIFISFLLFFFKVYSLFYYLKHNSEKYLNLYNILITLKLFINYICISWFEYHIIYAKNGSGLKSNNILILFIKYMLKTTSEIVFHSYKLSLLDLLGVDIHWLWLFSNPCSLKKSLETFLFICLYRAADKNKILYKWDNQRYYETSRIRKSSFFKLCWYFGLVLYLVKVYTCRDKKFEGKSIVIGVNCIACIISLVLSCVRVACSVDSILHVFFSYFRPQNLPLIEMCSTNHGWKSQ